MNPLRVLLSALTLSLASTALAAELIYADPEGVMRWRADDREVALFGANYSLPSASDYRAAGYVGADRKKLIEQDFAHFARMGWDGERLWFWGDWENSDRAGNLLANDHLDLLDYAIAEAKKRGIFVLFTPITGHSAQWPDAMDHTDAPGFSNYVTAYKMEEMGTNPAAIAAQVNYLRQIVAHVNPYTGVALKDEPQILFLELINEPWHHSENFRGSVAYINALGDAVRGTGCEKLLFFNVSQDFGIVPALRASRVQGATFAWYPTCLIANTTLRGNYLPYVDDYPPMRRDDLRRVPKLVYEFDSADLAEATMYPAMVRTFRSVGAQFIAMFSYDMLATAPYNLGWQTHFLNLVYSPRKAVAAMIAAEATRRLPRYENYGRYPDNTRFGPFRINYEENLAELVQPEVFMHAGDTKTSPPDLVRLQRIVGLGSSPVVSYEGCGAYFLDRLGDGLWRLELYPDAVLVQDPFAQQLNYKTISSRLVAHPWPMTVRLPGLGARFQLQAIDGNRSERTLAENATFEARPGVYLLSAKTDVDPARLSARVGRVGLREFVCPAAPKLPLQAVHTPAPELVAGQPLVFPVELVGPGLPAKTLLHLRARGAKAFSAYPLQRQRGYLYLATLPAGALPAGDCEYFISAETTAGRARFPAKGTWHSRVVTPREPLRLLDAATQDPRRLAFTRARSAGGTNPFEPRPAAGKNPAAFRFKIPFSCNASLQDYSASHIVKSLIDARGPILGTAQSLRVTARGRLGRHQSFITLVEADGTSWSAPFAPTADWSVLVIPLELFHLGRGVRLPLGYPGDWNYWLDPAVGRGGPGDRLNLARVERLQLSFRPDAAAATPADDPWADVARIELLFD